MTTASDPYEVPTMADVLAAVRAPRAPDTATAEVERDTGSDPWRA